MTHANAGIGSEERIVPMVVTSLLIITGVALALNRSFYNRTAADVFFSLTLASTAIVFLHVRPLWEALQLVVATCLLVLLRTLTLKVPLNTMSELALLGVGSLGLLAFRRIWSAGEERRLLHYAFLPPLLFVLLGYASSALLELTDRLHPTTLDLFLYNFDASLGLQPSFAAGQFVLRSPWLTRIALLFYFALPIPVMLIYANQLVRWGSGAMAAFLGLFVVGPAGVIFYNLLPACGPVYLFGSKFPFEPLSSQQVKEMLVHPVLISGVRNAFPSLHVAWALLASWYAEGLSNWTKFFVLLFLAGTVFATLGLGEHYFIDLVTALPFALMIQAGCALQIPWLDRRRCVPFLGGLLLMVSWVVLLRAGLGIMWVSPLIPWTLIAGTIISCLVFQPWLERGFPATIAQELNKIDRRLH
jgi:PAP2 superfamily